MGDQDQSDLSMDHTIWRVTDPEDVVDGCPMEKTKVEERDTLEKAEGLEEVGKEGPEE